MDTLFSSGIIKNTPKVSPSCNAPLCGVIPTRVGKLLEASRSSASAPLSSKSPVSGSKTATTVPAESFTSMRVPVSVSPVSDAASSSVVYVVTFTSLLSTVPLKVLLFERSSRFAGSPRTVNLPISPLTKLKVATPPVNLSTEFPLTATLSSPKVTFNSTSEKLSSVLMEPSDFFALTETV